MKLNHEDGYIKTIIVGNREAIPLEALYAALPFVQQTDIPNTLGCHTTENGYIEVDDFQNTSVEGIFACGDSTTMMRSIANAVSSGSIAGAMANMSLVGEEF